MVGRVRTHHDRKRIGRVVGMNEQQQLIEDCETREERLTDWERGFIDSIKHRLDDGLRLTPRQLETLTDVWERATAKG